MAAIDLADDCRTDPGRLRIALNAAALVLDNTRLAVEREAHLDQLKGAQARIVEAGLAERRRLERDLHDGAQQQLLAVSTTLSRARLLSEPDAVRATVDVAREQLATALADLRRLARGIHPGVLTQGGLVAGLEPLARADPRVELVLDERLESGLLLAPDVEFPLDGLSLGSTEFVGMKSGLAPDNDNSPKPPRSTLSVTNKV